MNVLLQNITKSFSGVTVLKNVTVAIAHGEIHALCGENGAGKSTLMKLLSGVYPSSSYQGHIRINGVDKQFKNIAESERAGIALISQELALVPEMSVADNIFLGNEIVSRGIIRSYETFSRASEILKKLEAGFSPRMRINELGIGQRQLVEIAKALVKKTELLILDEPTAALTETESKKLLQIMLGLKQLGITCIIISHKLKEVLSVADSITILRDGQLVSTVPRSTIDETGLVTKMVGRPVDDLFCRKQPSVVGDAIFKLHNFCAYDLLNKNKKVINNVSLHVNKGEIVGVAGLMGSGRTELVQAIFGTWPGIVSGSIIINGNTIAIKNPGDAIKNGLALLSEDRKKYGLHADNSIIKNITLAALRLFTARGIINKRAEQKAALEIVDKLKIKAISVQQNAGELSGGNQQKVVLGKWLITHPTFLILDEPTRGIDIGGKAEVYEIIEQLASDGTAILMVSSELTELLGITDRIYVMHNGSIVGCIQTQQATEEKIMQAAFGSSTVDTII